MFILDMATMAGGEYTSVKDFYRDRSIFITGGTGFMGKVLVEKLLRSCPDIKNIYLLMRPKKGQNVQERLQELLNAPVIISPYFCVIAISKNLYIIFLSSVIWKITTGFSGWAVQDHTCGWWCHGTRTGNLSKRSGYANTIGIGRFSFSGHR